jgi:Flp pilus assembly protein TadD
MKIKSIVINTVQGLLALQLLACSATAEKKQTADVNQQQTNYERTVALARQAEEEGQLDQALLLYVKSLDIRADDAKILYNIGNIHHQLGSNKLARRAFNQSLTLDGDNIATLTKLGILSLASKDVVQARHYIEKAVHLDQARLVSQPKAEQSAYHLPDADSLLESYNALGVLKDLQGEHLSAQSLFKLCLLLHKSANTLNNLGYSFYLTGNYILAEEYFKKAIDINPKCERAWSNLGLIYVRNGQYNRAFQTLKQVMSDADAYNDIGYLLMLEGRHQEAEYFLQHAIEASPVYFEKAYSNLEYVQLYLNDSINMQINR